ncbi:MAG: hypothetical protein JSU86_16200 [Phycisphaerales bacterium]|nr:MAG: hypothetical protein JSU86_16200 [Phycisphaerales bacterium]
MDHQPDEHPHRTLQVAEEPLDAASQSLADALRASFSVLKGIMLVLLVLYLFSNVRSIESHEEALILRLGGLRRVVERPGLVWALPYPIDEIVPLPTKKSNDLLIDSHTFHRSENEIGKPLSFISRGYDQGLNPSLDGALLTADTGLAHVQWKVTYKINDVSSYITQIRGGSVEAADRLIRVLVETVAVQLASELTAEQIIRTRIDYVQSQMKRRINERLATLNSGVDVTLVEMYEPTPPLQVRNVFDATQRAENRQEQRIRAAEKERTKILSEAAGASHQRLIRLFEQLDRGGTEEKSVDKLREELDQLLVEEVEGEAGTRIKEASAYRATVVSQMESDVGLYRTLLPEYTRNPTVLIGRLWEETKQQIFESPGVTKFLRPPGLREFRLKIPLDPEQTRIEEAQRLRKEKFEESKVRRRERLVPVGPEYD